METQLLLPHRDHLQPGLTLYTPPAPQPSPPHHHSIYSKPHKDAKKTIGRKLIFRLSEERKIGEFFGL